MGKYTWGNVVQIDTSATHSGENDEQIKQEVCITIIDNTLITKIIELGSSSVCELDILKDIKIFYY